MPMQVNDVVRLSKSALNAFFKPLKVDKNSLIHLQIEPTNYCNIKCISCPRELVYKDKLRHLSLKDFIYVLDNLKPIYLMLSGLGEPFLARKYR